MKNIFDIDSEKLYKIVENAYRKFKSNLYYANNQHYLKKRLVDFEASDKKMTVAFQSIVEFLQNSNSNLPLRKKWIKSITYRILPKMIEPEKSNEESGVIVNTPNTSASIRKVNFFIDADIEVFIIDTLWTLIIGKLFSEKGIISHCAKANRTQRYLFNNDNKDILDAIDFQSLNFFVPYYRNYKEWKRGAVLEVEKMYENKEDSILFSLDLTGYFYNVNIDFDQLSADLSNNGDDRCQTFEELTVFISDIYEKYANKLSSIRTEINGKRVLPIGLLSAAVLSNYYLHEFDKRALCTNARYYARYVDDMLFVFEDIHKNESQDLDALIKKYLSPLFEEKEIDGLSEKRIYLKDYESLYVQTAKVKIIKTDRNGSNAGLSNLLKSVLKASEPNLIPDLNVDLSTFSDGAYSFSDSNKIRDFDDWAMNKMQLLRLITDFLKVKKSTNFVQDVGKKKEKISQYETINETTKRQLEILFESNGVLDLYNRWEKVFYFVVLLTKEIEFTRKIYNAIYQMIDVISIDEIDYIKNRKLKDVEKQVRNELHFTLLYALYTALAVRIDAVKKEKYPKGMKNTIKNIRRANMFDNSLVAFPLINYLDDKKNLFSADIKHLLTTGSTFSEKKLKYTPRFIHFHEYLIFKQACNMCKLGDAEWFQKTVQEYNEIILPLFSQNIDLKKAISISGKKHGSDENQYYRQYITVESGSNTCGILPIGLVNMNVDKIKQIKLYKGKPIVRFSNLDIDNKMEIYTLLKSIIPNMPERVIFSEKGKANQAKLQTSFLVFPELSVPLEWLSEIAVFSKRTGTAIICGIRYFVDVNDSKRIYNCIATLLPIVDEKGYTSVLVKLREKNDYAPMERRILDAAGYKYNVKKAAEYDIFIWNGLRFSVFNCYELTDIFARATMKSNLDILFIPEYNKDINYFSNIIESASRDIYCFVAQVNSSNYGDTRIIGPFDKRYSNIVSIKGGEFSSVHIGRINIKEFREYQKYENTDEYNLELDEKIKRTLSAQEGPFSKYKKTSARHIKFGQ